MNGVILIKSIRYMLQSFGRIIGKKHNFNRMRAIKFRRLFYFQIFRRSFYVNLFQ